MCNDTDITVGDGDVQGVPRSACFPSLSSAPSSISQQTVGCEHC
jgi:hypothetical protein